MNLTLAENLSWKYFIFQLLSTKQQIRHFSSDCTLCWYVLFCRAITHLANQYIVSGAREEGGYIL